MIGRIKEKPQENISQAKTIARARSSLRTQFGQKSARRIGGHAFKAGDTVEVKDAPNRDVWRTGVVEKAADSMVRVRYTDCEMPDVEFIVNFNYMRPV